ncbi:type I methionyl aminopeptidase [Candidatus Nomurabacteria bacterium]|jgi:methionyl aminopeptidase|nr:type I methionyl aminopeptidase [Candidatus Saccharibacteria bacterium]MCB9839521.1 type I methionyl aminopeptidase [Candidatus Nomurabacteria bacterium]
MTKVKTPTEIENMRTSGQMLATVLDVVGKNLQENMTTKDIANIAAKEVKALGGKPTFLGMYGFPDVICVSVNDEVVHGIPGKYVIKNGDIVSFDFGVTYNGMITDAARSQIVGRPEKRTSNLLAGTLESLNAGIETLKNGVRVGDISAVIEEVLNGYDFGIVRELVGHGVGHELHEEPNIPNYGTAGTGPILKAGMTIAIEPMTTLGSHKVYTAADDWTIMTSDGSLSAHFEDTVLITETGSEILTRL